MKIQFLNLSISLAQILKSLKISFHSLCSARGEASSTKKYGSQQRAETPSARRNLFHSPQKPHFQPLLLILLSLLSNSLFAQKEIGLEEIIEKTGAYLFWDSLNTSGQLYKGEKSVLFVLTPLPMVRMEKKLLSASGGIQKNTEGAVLFSSQLAEQMIEYLGEKPEDLYHVSRIILDAGHGGKDSGAIGVSNRYRGKVGRLKEKEIVLDVARYLYDLLVKRYPEKEILLTRKDDTYLSLAERVDIANVEEINPYAISLYLSIHANASLNSKAEGFEVWYLPKEHSRTVISPNQYAKEDISVQKILNTLWQDEFLTDGQKLANYISDSLESEIGKETPNRGLKKDTWFVVRNARMAAVLVEIGFITNKRESKQLSQSKYLKRVTKGLYTGIEGFIDEIE